MNRTFNLIVLTIVLAACQNQSAKEDQNTKNTETSTSIKYATGFTVRYENGVKWVEVPIPYQGAKSGFKYLLVPSGVEIPAHDESTQVIEIPVTNIVCTSTTHIPLLDYINETSSLSGFPTTDYISSKKMRARIDSGAVMELGVDKEMNLELLVSLEPEMVMTYTISGELGQFKQIQNAGIPVVINAEYLEKHPLGRAEWIKFMSLFFNKEAFADSVFSEIETKYNTLKNIAQEVDTKPKVLSGIVYGDTWFMPGGQNYASKILKDAGTDYMWSDDSTSGFLELSFEAVYDKAESADYWIGVGSYKSLESMKSTDARYADFKAFKEGHVYTYNAREGAKGGSEFLELGYLRPDLILEDLIKITHPGLLESDELYFHGKLDLTAEKTEKH